MAVKEKSLESNDEFEWNVENEIQLFFAMNGHKPVGVNKYFHMVCIWEKFRAATHKDISLKPIWDHLESMYDLMALDDMEDLPFPSNEVDFNLPEGEFHNLMKSSRKKEEPESNKSKEQKDKFKDVAKKEKDLKETPKKDSLPRDQKITKEAEKKKEEVKKVVKEPEIKKDKQRDIKDVKKDYKTSKSRPKGKDEIEEASPNSVFWFQ
ncbi:MRG/MORF4L-binding protein isoform X2 [Venturia canescens]|uniref:MRG/MORF4L-binding protein isoform X2 n=1 Tax=Venturia canescens TaxID=32260 RepID=UPI001C9C597B|nr:MRG/MORF4L-binding protein isoform X2 [Venturia canescens]